MRLTASRIMFAPWPVFQSLHAGQRTFAIESRTENFTSGSDSNSSARFRSRWPRGWEFNRISSNASCCFFDNSLNAARPANFFSASHWSFCFSSGSSSSNSRAAANPSDALASPVAQMSTKRCNASSFCLDAEFVTRRARRALAAAKPAALVKNQQLDGGKQFRGGHQTDRYPRPAEDSLDDFAVRIIRDDDTVLDRVAADDAAGGNFQIENRVVRRGKL